MPCRKIKKQIKDLSLSNPYLKYSEENTGLTLHESDLRGIFNDLTLLTMKTKVKIKN